MCLWRLLAVAWEAFLRGPNLSHSYTNASLSTTTTMTTAITTSTTTTTNTLNTSAPLSTGRSNVSTYRQATSPLTSPKTNRPSLETSETCPCLCIKASLAGSSMLEMWTNDQKVELADSGQGGLQIREFTRSRGFRLQAGSIIISTENPNPSNPNINWLLTRSSQLAYDPYICQASDANNHFQFQYAPRPDLTDTLLFLTFLSEF